jgi:hypothetical protein
MIFKVKLIQSECIFLQFHVKRLSVHVHVAGNTCNVAVDPCSSSPCQNAGTCMQVGTTGYRCACAEGFRGSSCEEEEQSECFTQNGMRFSL